MYKDLSKTLKTIGDKNRLEIIDLLSCGELCACDLLEHFSFSQPPHEGTCCRGNCDG